MSCHVLDHSFAMCKIRRAAPPSIPQIFPDLFPVLCPFKMCAFELKLKCSHTDTVVLHLSAFGLSQTPPPQDQPAASLGSSVPK